MSLRTANYRDEVIGGIGALLGVDPRDLQSQTANTWAQRVNSWVRKGWDYWQWKQLQLTEERAFRQVYTSLLNYRAGLDEVYFLETASYFRAIADVNPGETPANTAAKWIPLDFFERYLAFDQYGDQSIGKIISLNWCDPSVGASWNRRVDFTLDGNGARVDSGGNTVWVTYQVRQPIFTGAQYDSTTYYSRDALVYDPESGECYRALGESAGEPVANGLYWYPQEMPYLLSEYVQYGAASDLAEDLATKSAYAGEAEERIAREINNELEQGVQTHFSLRQKQRRRFGWELAGLPCVA